MNREEKEDILGLIEEKKKNLEPLEKGSQYIKELSEIALLEIEIESYDSAERNLLICLEYFKNLKDSLGIAATYGLLGTLFFKKENYLDSIEYYLKAYELYIELNQKTEEITCLRIIGQSWMKLGDLGKANQYLLECSAKSADYNDIYSLLDCLGFLITIHEEQKEWDIVYELYLKSLEAFKELKDSKGITTSYFNLGIIDQKHNRYDASLLNFKNGTNYAIDANYSELIIKGLSYVAQTLFYLGKIKSASIELIKALSLARKLNAKNTITQIKILLKSFGMDEETIQRFLDNNQTDEISGYN